MARRSSPARLVIALGVAAMLAVFLVYTSIAGGTPQLAPSELGSRTGEVTIVGKVVAPVQRSGRTIRFRLRDVEGGSTVRLPVTYSGSVPDMFRVGRDISLKGRLRNGTFVGAPGTLVTKCPSKYSSKKTS
ncbi:MAG TPA: cytochrome c maturation protein CcmE [Gaiellaceae bacterium]|nr:cytochrome c maturation protein CcmE [Gaiellaceae bacterium]